jgi:two-component system, chemotaxis family, CheB/CheR fusion protein
MTDQQIRPSATVPESDPKATIIDAPSHYIGIGASAGGLEAIEEFFKHMPPKSSLGFIVIQHLSPDYKSLMVELLSKHTEIPIFRAEDGMQVKADAIYLIPPKKNLTIFHGRLLLNDQEPVRGINLPIDIFLRSLAEDQSEKSIAVILSGTGSDGTRGVRAIKEAGGMVMVQDEETAKFDGMPRSAIATGVADFILAPKDMSRQLLSFIKHPYATKSEYSDTILTDEDGLTRIFSLLRERHKIDFTYYKPSTVVRRIERRMTVNQMHELQDYVKFLQSYPREVSALYRELLIGVTSFFRDTDAYKLLEDKWLPELLREMPAGQIRFWVTACSTGEEAYSLAILCRECLEKIGISRDVKIFATDIDEEAILHAGGGIYPESITADLSPNLLSKYFYRKEDGFFHISRTIREMVVFAKHNIIKDPPFTHISLVSCRNLLIYLQPVLQRKVLELMNFSLLPKGILFLGSSETIGDMTDYFEAVDHRWKLYQSKGRALKAAGRHTGEALFTPAARHRMPVMGRLPNLRQHEEERVSERVLQAIATDFFTCAFIVNDQMELQHILGEAEGFLRFPPGKVLNDIAKIAVKDLAIPLSTGIQKVLKTREEIRYSNIRLKREEGKIQTVQMRLKPLPEKRNQDSMVMVFIEEAKETADNRKQTTTTTFDIGKEAEQRILDLEQELQFSRENLQATIEELETSNEELQATNEELLASNEELQSTNEELQSVNEELYTVNAEYQKKIIELTELNNDINNLLSSSDIAKIFLDENLDIRMFTHRIHDVFKVLDSDIGRPFSHISHTLDHPALMDDILRVQKTDDPIRREVRTKDGYWYLLKILPYYISPQSTSGIVLTLTDITELKEAHQKIQQQIETLRFSEEKHRVLFESMAQGVVYQDASGNIIEANAAAERILGLSIDQMKGRTSMDPRWKSMREDGTPFPGEEHPAMVALKTGQKVNNVMMGVFHPDEKVTRWININAVPKFREGESKPYEVFATFDDITNLKQSQYQYELLFQSMEHGFAYHRIITNDSGEPVDYIFLEINRAFSRLTGLKRKTVLNRRVTEVLPGPLEETSEWIKKYGGVAQTGKPLSFKQYSQALKQWFQVSAYSPEKDHFVTLFEILPTEAEEGP